ncbi:uncharacterized protein LOC143577506 [Bidens hawaiensis]|uniref:uncharacterized protein LOC143577506 n=1 Tax=Bidens hawaiensis TaxID=980011 RepID=UPI0040495B8C
MWRKVIWAIHGGSRAWNNIPAKLSISGPWKQIAVVPGILESLNADTCLWFKGRIGCGSSIMFWLDYWIGDELLSTSFPALFALERNKRCTVTDWVLMGPAGVGFSWNWKRVGLSDDESAELSETLVFLGDVALNGSKDRWVFTPNGLCGFSVDTVKLLISENRQYRLQSRFVWSRWVPKKVCVVAWRANLGQLPTAAALQRRSIPIVNDLCNFCHLQMECTEHVFTGCPFVSEVWQQVWRWCNIPAQVIFHVSDLLGIHKSAMSGQRQRETLYAVVLTTFWSVWRARNEAVFNHKEPSVQAIVEEVKVMIFLSIRNRATMGNMTWEAWRRFDTCKMDRSGTRP